MSEGVISDVAGAQKVLVKAAAKGTMTKKGWKIRLPRRLAGRVPLFNWTTLTRACLKPLSELAMQANRCRGRGPADMDEN